MTRNGTWPTVPFPGCPGSRWSWISTSLGDGVTSPEASSLGWKPRNMERVLSLWSCAVFFFLSASIGKVDPWPGCRGDKGLPDGFSVNLAYVGSRHKGHSKATREQGPGNVSLGPSFGVHLYVCVCLCTHVSVCVCFIDLEVTILC